jgi:hypothetical protein
VTIELAVRTATSGDAVTIARIFRAAMATPAVVGAPAA